jgi:hypothetical protein
MDMGRRKLMMKIVGLELQLTRGFGVVCKM